jgi:UDP-N-acetylglucosamine 2-epimerase (non-hydrolysing)
MGNFSLRQFVRLNSNNPLFFIGTRAELIKVTPVIVKLAQADVPVKIIWAGLHSETALDLAKFENVSRLSFNKSIKDQDSIVGVFIWFLRDLARVLFHGLLARVSRFGPKIIVVHGDTLCTVLGSFYAKASGATLMHIEAGVRSGKLWRPFPEEISRRFVSRVADVHFAPGDRESQNLHRHRGEVVNTIHNTSRDALSLLVNNSQFCDDGYLLVTLHRTELLSNKKRFLEIVQKIIDLSAVYQIKWYIGNHERGALSSVGLLGTVTQSSIELSSRSGHTDFVKTLVRAHCVITDSGGLQSECHDLAIPVIVHRNESEYPIPDNSLGVLTKWELAAIDSFLLDVNSGAVPRGIRSKIVAAEIISLHIANEFKGA